MISYKKSSLHLEEYVSINKLNQYLFHAGSNINNPVLLFLHGGPGESFSLFSHIFQQKLEDIYTIVHWDQRGAGKTYNKNRKAELPTIDLLMDDLYKIIQHLKSKYKKDKIVILGQSWGTLLGSKFIKKFPNEVEYYISVNQIISMHDNERIGFNKVKDAILEANDKKDLKRLEEIVDYPPTYYTKDIWTDVAMLRFLQGKYGLGTNFNFSLVNNLLKSPIFKLSDIKSLLTMPNRPTNKHLFTFLWDFDLRFMDYNYTVPIYYILGDKDFQSPYIIAEEYFNKIEAPSKELILLNGVGHNLILENPQLFVETLYKINKSTLV